jgi:hypothetical protein
MNGSLPRLSYDRDVDDRLLCTTGMGPKSWDWRSGVPSLLGRAGGGGALGEAAAGAAAAAAAGFGRTLGALAAGEGEVMTGRAGSRAALEGEGEASSFRFLLMSFWDDFRGGGLGGGGGSRFAFLPGSFLSPSRTVEFDDDEVRDSRTAARPRTSALRGSPSFGTLPALLRVTGGRVWAGLALVALGGAIRMGATRLGDCDEIDVGVVSRL